MSWIRRTFGLDGVDLAIHFGVTVAVIVFGAAFFSHGAAETMMAAVWGGSLTVLGVRRHWALKRMPTAPVGEITGERMAELESRLSEMDGMYLRLQELEERVDFAERLLAQAREPERLT